MGEQGAAVAPFDYAPVLEGKLVRLRPLHADDFDALFAVAQDPAIWAVHPAHDRWQEPVFRRFFDDAIQAGGALVVEDRATGAIIGSSRYSAARALPGEMEIGWTFLARSHWGGTVNAEMKTLMLEHLFRWYPTAIFLVGESNGRSRRAMEKIGGKLIDRVFDAEMAGVIVRHVIYAIARDEWRVRQG